MKRFHAFESMVATYTSLGRTGMEKERALATRSPLELVFLNFFLCVCVCVCGLHETSSVGDQEVTCHARQEKPGELTFSPMKIVFKATFFFFNRHFCGRK